MLDTLNIEKITDAYFEVALWSSADDNADPLDDNYDTGDVAESAKQKQVSELKDWLSYCDELGLIEQFTQQHDSNRYSAEAMLGHDFWLTRNGHGAGFWDRGLGELGKQLSDACKTFGSCDPYVGDDDLIYFG